MMLVHENILPHLDHYLEDLQKINLLNQKEFFEKHNDNANWPGLRSDALNLHNKFLYFFIIQSVQKVFSLHNYNVSLFLHLRTAEDNSKDWIHSDNDVDLSFLIYLNNTNLNSGTYIYNNTNDIIADIKYVQNRLFIYDANYKHKGYGHFGNNSFDGRLTINGFLKKT
jgi:hypothetical protein